MKTILLFTLLTLSFAYNKKALEIHIFNVGNADSQLVVFPSGYSILIDCGDRDTTNASNTKHIAKRIETILGKKSIDVFVLTHYHGDHFGIKGKNGIWHLLEKQKFSIGKFIKRDIARYNGSKLSDCSKTTLKYKYLGSMDSTKAKFVCYSVSSKDKTKLSKVAENANICSTTQINPPDTGAKVTILMRDALGIKDEETGKKLSRDSRTDTLKVAENDFSICLRIQFGKFVYATCGDLTGYTYEVNSNKYHDVESYVAPMMGEVDLLNANHHGAKSATNEKWANTLKPTVTVVSCEGGDLPYSRTLENLKNVNSVVYTTGDSYSSTVEQYGATQMGDDVVVTVPTNGKKFTVASPSGKKSKTFNIKMNKKAPEACKKLY